MAIVCFAPHSSIFRFDVEKECDRIDGNELKNDPTTILNTGHPKIKKEVDSSCNELCTSYSTRVVYSTGTCKM